MAIVVWDGSLNTGIDTIDAQHKHLFEIINNLHEKMIRGDDEVFLLTTLDSLEQYIRFHFRTEEALMTKKGFPGQEKHMEEHRQFEDAVAAIEDQDEIDVRQKLREILSLLLGWLVDHIYDTDRELGKYLGSPTP